MAASKEERPGEGPDEATPLLSKPQLPSSWAHWWSVQTTERFRFAVSYSLRAAVWTVVISFLPLFLPHGRRGLADRGFPVWGIVCNFLFTLGPNVGTTVRNVICSFLGSGCAVLVATILFGIFPHGVEGAGSALGTLGLATAVCVAYVAALMFANVNENFRFFGLYAGFPYIMAFLEPREVGDQDYSEYKTTFRTLYRWPPIYDMRIELLGIGFAILCTLIPRPVSALGQLRADARGLAADCLGVARRLVEYYCGGRASLQADELISAVHHIRARRANVEGTLEAAEFECAWGGARGRSLRQAQELIAMTGDILEDLKILLPVVQRETFDESHCRFVENMRAPLCATLELMEATVETCGSALAPEGAGGEGAVGLQKKATLLAESVAELEQASAFKSGLQISQSTAGEHMMVCSACSMARSVLQRARACISIGGQEECNQVTTGWSTLARKLILEEGQAFGTDHTFWALRNSLTLVLCFVIGFRGKGSYIKPYNPNLVMNAVLLLSKSASSTFKKSKNRVFMVAMASILGQMSWAVLGYCGAHFRCATMICTYLYVQLFMYMAYSTDENAELGNRMAGIGVMYLLYPCETALSRASVYADYYKELSDLIVSVVILVAIETLLGEESPRDVAVSNMQKAIKAYHAVFEPYLCQSLSREVMLAELSTIEHKLDAAKASADEAIFEPDHWREQWRPMLFSETVSLFTKLCQDLRCIVTHLDDGMALRLMALPSFEPVRRELVADVDCAVGLVEAFLRPDGSGAGSVATLLQRDARGHDINGLDAFVADLGHTFDIELGPELCAVIETFVSLRYHLRDHLRRVVRHREA